MLEEQNTPLQDLLSLKDKTAIVTGGAQGLGLATVSRLAEAGASVVIIDIEPETGENAVKALAGAGRPVSFMVCDITDESRVKKTFGEIAEKHDGIDILVNNAGIYPRKPFVEMTGDDFRRVLEVNLTGTFLCSRYAVPVMIEKMRGGAIVNISSIEGVHPSSTGMSAYDASKAGVIMLTRSLARELGTHGIRVNAIAPGGMLTRAMTANLGETTGAEQKAGLKELKNFMRRMVLGRMGEADDIARTVLFLVSDMAEYITGELIAVDGGYLVS